jgi:hypothetical protein
MCVYQLVEPRGGGCFSVYVRVKLFSLLCILNNSTPSRYSFIELKKGYTTEILFFELIKS